MKRIKGVVVLIFCFMFSGCFAAAALPLLTAVSAVGWGVSGFGLYKVVQTTTGGEAQVRFDKEVFKDKVALSAIKGKTIAIYPTTGRETVRLAEVLLENGRFKIITPHAVEKALAPDRVIMDFDILTNQEKMNYMCEVCNKVKADGVLLVASARDAKVDVNALSFDRAESSLDFEVMLFSLKLKREIWRQKGQFVLKLGSRRPDSNEINNIFITAIAERFMEDVG